VSKVDRRGEVGKGVGASKLFFLSYFFETGSM
jgi:hypothetical protein